MAGQTLPDDYVAHVIRLHKGGFGYRKIADELVGKYEFATPASVKKVLTKWRKRTGVKSQRTITRELNEQVISYYESTGCKLTRSELAAWANENAPRVDETWTPLLISQTLTEWRDRTGRLNQWELRAIGTLDRINELMTTGHTAKMVAEIFNAEQYQLAKGRPWTDSAVKQYRSKYSKRFNIDLLSTAYRSEQQCIEIAFFAQMCRVDGYDAPQVVDLLNESVDLRHWWYHGRPWTRTMLNNTIYRARHILNEIEGADSMSSIIDSHDQRTITAAAVASIAVDGVESTETIEQPSKLEKLRMVAYRCAELRDEGARNSDLIEILNSEHARPGGWDTLSIAAVENYGKRNVAFVGRVRDPEVMSALSERVHLMRATMTHAQVVEVLNAEHVQNEIVPGAAWTVMHTQKLTSWRGSQAKRKSISKQQEPSTTDTVTGRRRMRPADVAMRDHARERLAMRDAAFERAAELHAQIAELRAQLSQAQHVVELGNEAEQMLICTGPPQLHEHLNKLKANTSTAANKDALTSHQKEIEVTTRRLLHEDWR